MRSIRTEEFCNVAGGSATGDLSLRTLVGDGRPFEPVCGPTKGPIICVYPKPTAPKPPTIICVYRPAPETSAG